MSIVDTPLSLESRLRRIYGDLSAAERKLADVLLQRQSQVLGYTATELATLAGTSKSSAARFFRRVGFADFEDFRQQMRSYQAEQSPLSRMGQAQRKDSLALRFQNHLRNDAQRLEAWAAAPADTHLVAALALLTKARKVWVLGYRHSQVTALYAQALLAQVRADVQSLNGVAGREADVLACAGSKDLLLAVDFRRRSAHLPRVVAAAKSQQMKVLLITDAPLSALAMQADVALRCGALAPDGLFDSYVCSMSLMNFLAAALVDQGQRAAHARLERIEHLHQVLGDLEAMP